VSTTGLQLLAQAQAREEGYYDTSNGVNLPQVLNNPLDITEGGTLLSYSDPNDSFNDFYNLLGNAGNSGSPYSPNETLQQFEDTYTGGDPNAAANVASILGGGVSPQTPISQIVGNTASQSQAASGGTASSTGPLSFLQQLFGYAANAATGGQLMGQSSTQLVSSSYLIRGVAILGGLILIAGAVFGFKSVQSTVVTGARRAAETGAELSA
jgi:hypothetical protein